MAIRSANLNVMMRAAEKAGRALVRDFGEVEQLQVMSHSRLSVWRPPGILAPRHWAEAEDVYGI